MDREVNKAEVEVDKRKVRVRKGFSKVLAAALDEELESNRAGRVRSETDMTDRCVASRARLFFQMATTLHARRSWLSHASEHSHVTSASDLV